jgi:hypothetical protein
MKIISIFSLVLFNFIFAQTNNRNKFDGNNISTYIWPSGIMHQRYSPFNNTGFEWPKGSGKTAIFTEGLTIAAYVNGQFRMASCSYLGELAPGYVLTINNLPVAKTDGRFRIYKVDSANPLDSDWLNWGTMVPFGAPFYDVNNNGIYDPYIDKPGVKGAKQTLFVCLTDGFPEEHKVGEGFGGGTQPLFAEYHFTVWGYDSDPYKDVMFLKWVVINKNNQAWDSTFFSIFSDPDLGYSDDDYIGCDTTRNLTYCYNADNDDNGGPNSYGLNPPAIGTMFLNCSGGNAKLSSFVYAKPNSATETACEVPQENLQCYNFMKGVKRDGTPWINITNNQPTKFCYPGDPESGIGWTEYSGRIANCGGQLTGEHIIPVPPADRKSLMNYKPTVQKINPGDSQVILTAQLIAKGTDNKNSVTSLKHLADVTRNLCQNNFVTGINMISSEIPNMYNLHQNYPNPFNPVTKIKFDLPKSGIVLIKIYNAAGKEIATLVNGRLSAGEFSVDWDGFNHPSGVYFCKLESENLAKTIKMLLVK